jgi:glycerol-3-phosphate cytidylyltransferase
MQTATRYHKEDFSNAVEMSFEDTVMRMPVGYDRYLSSLYPSYMTPPPKEKQVPHYFDGIIDLNNSFTYHIAVRDGKRIGYTAGCYDLFHIGHMNLLRRAKEACDYLIVGVNSDEAMYSYKKKRPVIPEDERVSIVRGLRCVDEVVLVTDTDKYEAYKKHKYDVIFVGDDHKGEPKWVELEKKLAKKGSRVHYFGYTKHISSSKLRENLKK